MGVFDKLVMTDEEKEQARQLNKISYINALNTHNQELQQKVLMLTATNEELHKQAEMNGRLLTENAELRAENEKLLLELDMQQATILVPSQKDDQRRIERLDAALKEALDEAASIRAENEKLRDVLKNCIAALRHAYFHGFTELYKTTADEAAAALWESGE